MLQRNLDIVFFIYGLSFFVMGTAILAQPRRGSTFDLSRILWLLAGFGLLHGTNEWLDMWAFIKGRETAYDLVRWFCLVISYLFIFEFGRNLVRQNLRRSSKGGLVHLLNWWLTPALGALIIIQALFAQDFWQTGSTWTRYLYGFPGAVLSGIGFVLYYKGERERLEPLRVGKYFYLSGGLFCAYGLLGGLVVPPGGFFPANWLNTTSFRETVGVPVQVFRLFIALGSAWGVVSVLRIFNWESRIRLEEALEAASNTNVALEARVEERTAELQAANAKLNEEAEERARLEDELIKAQKLESLGVLAGGIAHDFNNLLAGLYGCIYIAKTLAEQNSRAYKWLTDAEDTIEQAKGLTGQLLTFSKGGAPVKKTASVTELIMESVNFTLRGSNVKCRYLIADGLQPVEGDKGQISQVLNNLVINAAQAMPEGGTITLRADNFLLEKDSVYPLLKRGRYVILEVEDQGVGIPEKNLSKVFDPYFSTKPIGVKKGTGLGLAICHSIVKKHGGAITIDSVEGKGTRVMVYLPASKSVDTGAMEEKAPAMPESSHTKSASRKVLVVDDDEMIRRVGGKMLSSLGFEVDFAQDGNAACVLYEKARGQGNPFDLVIMNLTIPGAMGGVDAAKKLLEVDPGARVLVCSGYSNDPVMAEYWKYGFQGAVGKPYTLKELKNAIELAMHP